MYPIKDSGRIESESVQNENIDDIEVELQLKTILRNANLCGSTAGL